MNILVTGGTGFIGRHLIPLLLTQHHNIVVLTRNITKAKTLLDSHCLFVESLSDIPVQSLPQAVINLAGEAIANKYWTDKQKSLIRKSRINFTKNLVDWIKQSAPPLKVMISGSAMGYYGSQPPSIQLNESSKPVQGFTHQLCKDWEEQALVLEKIGCRVCLLRTGLVLAKEGGALAKMLPPFRFGLGGPISSGKQMMSWIYMNDLINAIVFLLNNQDLHGPFNLTAPKPVSNRQFSRTLGKILHRPAFFTVPKFVLKWLLGDGSELLVGGQNVVPERLLKAGFQFEHTELEEALLATLLSSNNPHY